MPILRFDLIEGRNEAELKTLLDAAHRAQLAAFKVPERDRFQIVHEHKRSQMIIEDRGLGIERSDKIVVVQVTSRHQHGSSEKVAFYKNLCEELKRACGVSLILSLAFNVSPRRELALLALHVCSLSRRHYDSCR
jgi:tautomerase-like protein